MAICALPELHALQLFLADAFPGEAFAAAVRALGWLLGGRGIEALLGVGLLALWEWTYSAFFGTRGQSTPSLPLRHANGMPHISY